MLGRNCPTCDEEMEHEEYDPDVGIQGGYYCSNCDKVYPDEDFDDEPDIMDYER